MSSAQSGADEGLSLKTLLISAAAAAVAAIVVQQFWQRGTLIAAAMTPVIIAVVSEALHKPVKKISEVSTWKRTPDGTAIREPVEPRRAQEPFDPLPPEELVEAPRVSSDDPYRLYQPRRSRRHHWRIALATGVLAFFIAAAVVTASELAIFGESVSEGGRRTTFFGGNDPDTSPKQDEEETPTASPTETPEDEESPTPTPTETATPEEESPTPTPTPTPSPPPGAAPEQPTPTTTPPPAATQTPQP
jgi:hypothetical protein